MEGGEGQVVMVANGNYSGLCLEQALGPSVGSEGPVQLTAQRYTPNVSPGDLSHGISRFIDHAG